MTEPRAIELQRRSERTRRANEAWVRRHLPDLDPALESYAALAVGKFRGRGQEPAPQQILELATYFALPRSER